MIDHEKETADDVIQHPISSAPNSDSSDRLLIANEHADLGHALRAIYQETVEENVPDEMMNLLDRLI